MAKNQMGIDPRLLTSFLAVADTLSFTTGAKNLGLSQPTVSQHVRALEEAVGRVLVLRDTRSVSLTDDGEAMAGFARTILAAQEQALSYFSGSQMRGRLRFGVSDDLALTQLPRILRDFRQLHPRVDLELTVTQSVLLHRRLQAGKLDLVYVKQDSREGEGHLVRRDRLVWVGLSSTKVPADEPVPLIAYYAPSLSRDAALHALERAGRTWRLTCNTREVNGVLAATRAGLGIAVFAQSLVPDDLVTLPSSLDLPELGEIDIVLRANPRAPAELTEPLIRAIRDNAFRQRPVGAPAGRPV